MQFMSFRERRAFWGELQGNFEQTGAIHPSSRFLARAMAGPLRRARRGAAAKALRILEIGPGTGAVTREIARSMGPADTLDCYEINARFVRFLEAEVRSDPAFGDVADRITIHHAPAQELNAEAPFDFAICSAPLNNFDADTISAILDTALASLAPSGSMTFFEYAVLPAIKRTFSSGAARRRMTAALAAKQARLARYGRGSTLVIRNLPPARVHELVGTNGDGAT